MVGEEPAGEAAWAIGRLAVPAEQTHFPLLKSGSSCFAGHVVEGSGTHKVLFSAPGCLVHVRVPPSSLQSLHLDLPVSSL